MAHQGVARANALQARTLQGADADAARVRTLASYKDFLALWKDADPDKAVSQELPATSRKELRQFCLLSFGFFQDGDASGGRAIDPL